jgi:exoribonuclease-2
MIHATSLALYKNRPVLVTEVRDRIDIRLDDGSVLKVREKDLVLLHEGPAKEIPLPSEGGDFETARKMLAGPAAASLPWAELAELVFGESGPAQALACWIEANRGLLFRIEEGLPYPMDDEAVAKETQKRARKESEAAEKAAFLERAKHIKTERKNPPVDGVPTKFEELDGRFLSEVEALAYGKSEKSKTCVELGLSETPEAAHAFLLAVGYWDETVNPYPYRAGCPLLAPKVALGPDVDDLPRTDLTVMTSWAIDNAWSKDPDDAIGWDGSSVWVHVADPASAILPDSPADKEALGRGTTLYLPELTAPMLADEALERFGLGLSRPEACSGSAVSHPAHSGETAYRGELSPALSFHINVAEDGSVSAVEAMASIVRVRRTSYGEADKIIDGGGSPELAALALLAEKRRTRRVANGAIEIDIPEVRIKVEGEGRSREIDIETVPDDRSSGIVREMMLLAGEAAARWAFERKLPFPFYGQESPSEMNETAMGTGLAAQFARRRLMRAGMWGPGPSAHRGLGLPFYAQVTSPLRRYQDLLGHMQLRAFLAGREFLDADEVSRRCALAQAASAATRQAERGSDQHWALAYLSRRPNWRGEAVLVGNSGPGTWQAYIPELGLETKLKLGSGRSLDERITVRLVRINLATLESSFEEAPGA